MKRKITKTEYCGSLREVLYLLSHGESECFKRTIKTKRPWFLHVYVAVRAELCEHPSQLSIKHSNLVQSILGILRKTGALAN